MHGLPTDQVVPLLTLMHSSLSSKLCNCLCSLLLHPQGTNVLDMSMRLKLNYRWFRTLVTHLISRFLRAGILYTKPSREVCERASGITPHPGLLHKVYRGNKSPSLVCIYKYTEPIFSGWTAGSTHLVSQTTGHHFFNSSSDSRIREVLQIRNPETPTSTLQQTTPTSRSTREIVTPYYWLQAVCNIKRHQSKCKMKESTKNIVTLFKYTYGFDGKMAHFQDCKKRRWWTYSATRSSKAFGDES